MTTLKGVTAHLTACLTAAAFACALLLPIARGYAQADPLTDFYRNYDLETVPALIRTLEQRGILKLRDNQPPVIGFLTALFERNPRFIDRWTQGSFAQETQWIIANCLDLAGQHDKAMAFARTNGWPSARSDLLRSGRDDLMSMSVSSTTDLDMLWGASFATGDPRFVNRIIDFLDRGVRSGTYAMADIQLVGSTGSAASARMVGDRMKEKYGPVDFVPLLSYGAALGALQSNAGRHDFVRAAVRDRIAAAPKSKTARLMKTVVLGRAS